MGNHGGSVAFAIPADSADSVSTELGVLFANLEHEEVVLVSAVHLLFFLHNEKSSFRQKKKFRKIKINVDPDVY